MNKYEELAASIIDDVLEMVEEQHPEIEIPDESSLIYGVDYYNLECQIATMIKQFVMDAKV